MFIHPRGKIRLMEAQSYNPMYDTKPTTGQSSDITEEPGNDHPTADIVGNEPIPEIEPEINPEIDEETGGLEERGILDKEQGNTLSGYIFKKLESFGYPARRLEEFKKKFVNQDLAADGVETVKIEIPDKTYPDPHTGQAKDIEKRELSEIIREINGKFGLNFNGAHRAEGKWTIDFTSAKMPTGEEAGEVHDNLDEVYGSPSKGRVGKSKKPLIDRAAYSLPEMLKAYRNKMVNRIINGG